MSEITSASYTIPFHPEAKFLKYFEVAKVNYLTSATYLINLLSRSAQVLIRVWIFSQLYQVTYQASGASEINGLTVVTVVWILMLTQSLQTSTRPHVSRIIEDEVKSGVLAYSINRPYSYVLFHYAGYLGRTLSSLIVNIFIGALVTLVLVGPIALTPAGIVFGGILLFFGMTLNYLIYMIIGLLAFWLEDTSPLTWIYSKAQLIFGGLILPLALFPESIKGLAEILPFSQLFYTGAAILINFDLASFQRFFLIQLFWLTFFGLIVYFLFKKGIKNVSVYGG